MTDETLAQDMETQTPQETISQETIAAPIAAVTTNILDIKSGQTVRVHERIKDVTPKGDIKERIQIFEGIVLGIKGAGVSRTVTVRKVAAGGYGVEKIYPVNSPVIAKIELVKTAKVKRAKLSFLSNVKHPFKRKFKETYVK